MRRATASRPGRTGADGQEGLVQHATHLSAEIAVEHFGGAATVTVLRR